MATLTTYVNSDYFMQNISKDDYGVQLYVQNGVINKFGAYNCRVVVIAYMNADDSDKQQQVYKIIDCSRDSDGVRLNLVMSMKVPDALKCEKVFKCLICRRISRYNDITYHK